MKQLKIKLAITLVVGATQASAGTYAFVDLGTLGGTQSSAYNLNNIGQVVGQSLTSHDADSHYTLWNSGSLIDRYPDGKGADINDSGQIAGQTSVFFGPNIYNWGWRATVWNGSTMTILDSLPGAVHSWATAINNSGQVVGPTVIESFQGHYHATLWNGMTPTDLGSGIRTDSYALDINSSGTVSGFVYGDDGVEHASVWAGGVISELQGLPGGDESYANAINDAGLTVGYSQIANRRVATLWSGASVSTLSSVPNSSNVATDINNYNQIVGYSVISSTYHATLWNGQIETDLNSFLDANTVAAGWVLQYASAINDKGWIIGDAYNSISGETHGFMLMPNSPVPEPSTFALMIAGFGTAGGILRANLAANRRRERMRNQGYILAV